MLEGTILFIRQCSIVQLHAKCKLSGNLPSAEPKIKGSINLSQIFTGLA